MNGTGVILTSLRIVLVQGSDEIRVIYECPIVRCSIKVMRHARAASNYVSVMSPATRNAVRYPISLVRVYDRVMLYIM